MKSFKNLGTTLLLVLFSLRCGTEIGNPSIDDVDFQAASADGVTGYIANTGTLTFTSPQSKISKFLSFLTGTRAQVTQDLTNNPDDFKNSPLLKVLSSGRLEPAITVNQGGKLPKVIRLAKASNNRTYVLFNSEINIAGALCRLIEIDTANKLRCIDSTDYPAYLEGPNYLFDQETDKKNFLVAIKPGTEDEVIYKSANPVSISFSTRYNLAIRRAGGVGTITSNVTFDRTQQLASGEIVGFQCFFQTAGIYTPHCLLQIDGQQYNVVDLATELNNSTEHYNFAFPLRDDDVLISSKSINTSLHLHEGPVAVPISSATYTTDYRGNFMSTEYQYTSEYDLVYQHTSGDIFGLSLGEDAGIYDGYITKPLDGTLFETFLGYKPKAFEASPGERILVSGTNVNDPTDTRVIVVDPLTFAQQRLNPSLLDIEVVAIRNIATSKTMAAGPSKTDPAVFKYYLYNFADNTATLLFTSTEFVDLHTL